MNRYKRFVPVVALVLVVLGVNLDQFGIDLHALVGNGSGAGSSSSESSQNRDSQASGAGEHAQAGRHQGPQWSDTRPNVNLWHVFEGEINRSGKPTGFHARPGGEDPAGARVAAIRDAPNQAGVYTASVEIQDGGQWKEKFSSFFPDRLSREQVLELIVQAYANSDNPNAQPWSGPSGQGFEIQGYTSSRGGINTAFPVYTRAQ